MENNQQNTTQPPTTKRRSIVAEVITGGVLGAIIGGIVSWFNKKSTTKRQIGIGAAIGVGAGLLSNLFAKKPAEQEIPVQTMLPPAAPTRAIELYSGSGARFLDYLVTKGEMTPAQQAEVLQEVSAGSNKFVGEIAVSKGFITLPKMVETLASQSTWKVEDALEDIKNIVQTGQRLGAPVTVRPHWGNNGVNPAPAQPVRIDGLSATANIAENLAILANTNPSPALLPTIQEGIIAAAYLSRGIEQGDSAVVPLAKLSENWRTTMNNALKIAAQANPQTLTDSKGTPINIDQFIAARNAEITAAIQQSLAIGNDRSQSQAR